ncbi:protein phyllopod [Anopheles maculipalpis]|uniref:protein phyllopod n=1 Tax=Anopheles maculipalpis TaxID=1496333 RepID=UPI0021594A77|nr:protein phyllopod [Anopheles maculipalpis]
MSSSASSSTAGSNAQGGGAAAAAAAAAGPTSQSSGHEVSEISNGTDGSGHPNQHASGAGPGGNIVEKQANGGGGVGHPGTEPRTSSPAHRRNGGANGTTSTTGTVLRRKTNVCLICGIYTNLSLNIFEPRNGPNIVDVIYEKYKFRAERGDNADKHICFSCNNWLINWYSLQNTSSGNSRSYEPAPSTSRSSSAADSSNNSRHGRHHSHGKPRTKSRDYRTIAVSPNDKENRHQKPRQPTNPDQHGQISSTTTFSTDEEPKNYPRATTHTRRNVNPYSINAINAYNSARRASFALKEQNGQRGSANVWKDLPVVEAASKDEDSENVVSSSTERQSFDPYTILVKPYESRLIQMLEGQGTSVTKEVVPRTWNPRTLDSINGNNVTVVQRRNGNPDANGNGSNDLQRGKHAKQEDEDDCKEIVISFDTALSEVIDVVPSLKALQSSNGDVNMDDPVRSLRSRLSSGALTVSVLPVDTV